MADDNSGMRRSAAKVTGQRKGQFDQRLAAGASAEQRAKNDIEHQQHQDIDEASQQSGIVVDQSVADEFAPRCQAAHFLAENGDQIFVLAVRPNTYQFITVRKV